MFMMRADVRPGGGYIDEPLYSQIQEVYAKYLILDLIGQQKLRKLL